MIGSVYVVQTQALTETQAAIVLVAVLENRKVDAIKYVRDETNSTLQEAKNCVDRLIADIKHEGWSYNK